MVSTQPLTEMSIRNISWRVGQTSLPPSSATVYKFWVHQPPGPLKGLSMPIQHLPLHVISFVADSRLLACGNDRQSVTLLDVYGHCPQHQVSVNDDLDFTQIRVIFL